MVNGARDFRLMRRNMVDAVLQLSEYNRFQRDLQLGWFDTEYIAYENRERVAVRRPGHFGSYSNIRLTVSSTFHTP